MPGILVVCVMLVPWVGAVAVWSVRDSRPRAQHSMAIGFSLLAGLSAIALMFYSGKDIVLRIPVGRFFGEETFLADVWAVF